MLNFNIVGKQEEHAQLWASGKGASVAAFDLGTDLRIMQAVKLIDAAANLLPQGGDLQDTIKELRQIAKRL